MTPQQELRKAWAHIPEDEETATKLMDSLQPVSYLDVIDQKDEAFRLLGGEGLTWARALLIFGTSAYMSRQLDRPLDGEGRQALFIYLISDDQEFTELMDEMVDIPPKIVFKQQVKAYFLLRDADLEHAIDLLNYGAFSYATHVREVLDGRTD